MNILFINHGDFACNSMNHIAAFANELSRRGHACIVASPHSLATAAALDHPLFLPRLFSDVLAKPNLFPNGQPADLLHAWTPREIVRSFVEAYLTQTATSAPLPYLLVHLEDNEEYLTSQALGIPFDQLRSKPQSQLNSLLPPELAHPRRYRNFLRLADGITGITERLADFTPPNIPFQLLTPGVDFRRLAPRPNTAALRQTLGLNPHEKVLSYTGNSHFANTPEVRNLHLAVQILNDRGTPTRLVRTGGKAQQFVDTFAPAAAPYVLNLGVVESNALPNVLALADVLVQPGADDPFNRYRFPSKIPEFFAMAKPVVLPQTNIAHHLTDGTHALFLTTGSPEEIADKCQTLFNDPALCQRLGQAALAFAHAHFDIVPNTDVLAAFYQRLAAQPHNPALQSLASDPEPSQLSLLTALLRARLAWPPSPVSAAEIHELLTDIALEGAQLAPTQRDLAAACNQLTHTHNDLQTTRAELDATRSSLQSHQTQLHQTQLDLENLRAQLAHAALDLDAARKTLHDTTAQYQTELAWRQSMQASRSWKITRPLRYLAQLLRSTPPAPQP